MHFQTVDIVSSKNYSSVLKGTVNAASDPARLKESFSASPILNNQYDDAYNVAAPLCNAALGYLKAKAVMAISAAYIKKKKYDYAFNMAKELDIQITNYRQVENKKFSLLIYDG